MSNSVRPPWTAAHQAPPSTGFSRHELLSGLPCGRTKYQDENGKWKGECFTPHRIVVIQMEMTEKQKQNDE